MTKDEAREILENWITEKTGGEFDMNLPIVDEVIHTEIKPPESKIYKEVGDLIEDNRPIEFIQWNFKALIKLAYDLEDKK